MKRHLNGVELAWDEAGAGPPLVLLHAFPLDRRMWEPQVSAFSSHWRVITPDLRGAGESSWTDEDSFMERLAEDLAALLDYLGLARVVLGGLSMGGYAAFAFLRRYPARVSALVLADTRATADTDEGKKGRYEMAALAEREGAAAVAERMLPRLLGTTTHTRRPAVVSRVREMILANAGPGLAKLQRGMAARPDSRPLLGTIRCPTLALVGEEDVFTPLSDAEAMVQAIPGAKLVRLPEAGHLSNLEKPTAFNSALHDFLGQLRL